MSDNEKANEKKGDRKISRRTLEFWELSDKERNKLIKRSLQWYIFDQVGFEEIRFSDRLKTKSAKSLTDPHMASLIASYVALNTQENQGQTNIRLQVLIVIVALSSVLASVLPFFSHR